MNSKNSKTCDTHSLLLNLTNKINLKIRKICCFMQSCHLRYAEKYKTDIKNSKFELSSPTWNEILELSDGPRAYQAFKIIFSISSKKLERVTDSPSIRIYVNKIGRRNTFRIKTGYFLAFLTPETMKLLGITKSKTSKFENGENLTNLEISVVVLLYSNVVNNDYHFLINSLFNYSLQNIRFRVSYIEAWFTD